MKSSEIKNLLRYVCTPDLATTDYGVEWDGQAWTAQGGPTDPLGAILLTRQPPPPAQTLREYGAPDQIFPGSIARATIKEYLGVDDAWLDGFFDGLEGRPKPSSRKTTETKKAGEKDMGWDVGAYAYNRMHPKPEPISTLQDTPRVETRGTEG